MHRVPLRLLGWVLLCLLAIALGRQAVLPETRLALFWPAAGVGALWVLSSRPGRRLVLDCVGLGTVVAAYFLLVEPMGPAEALLLGAANVLQALVVRRVVRPPGRPAHPVQPGDPGPGGLPAIASTRQLSRLFAAAFAAGALGSVLGAAAVWSGGDPVGREVVLGWLVRNGCSTFVVAAAVLTCLPGSGRDRWRRVGVGSTRSLRVELALTLVTTVLVGLVMFGATRGTPLGFLLLGVAAWVGFRFAPAVGAAFSGVFGTLVIVLTLLGQGPFGTIGDLTARATVVQAFVTMATGLVLMLALGVAEKDALAERLARAEAHARTRADLLDAVTEAMTDGLCVSDSWGHVVLANSAAAELAGDDGHGHHVHQADAPGFLHPDGTPVEADHLPHARALRGERVERTDVVRVDPATGQETVLQTTAVPLHREAGLEPVDPQLPPPVPDPDRPPTGPLAVVLLHDVTHERAETRMLENFAGVVAHDLKAPLTSVLSWAEIALDQLADPAVTAHLVDGVADGLADGVADARASLTRIQGSATRMNALITDLLDYTLAGSAALQTRSIDLDQVVAEVVADLEVDGPAPVVQHEPLGHVLADPLLVRQLIANLVGNAVKYVADETLPRVLVESRVRGDRLEVRVGDNGIGIPAADRGRVFDSFFRSASSGDYPGTGLGLAICARAVERHGGRISARPGPDGHGTTMIFTLPLDPAPPAPDEPLASVEPASPVEPVETTPLASVEPASSVELVETTRPSSVEPVETTRPSSVEPVETTRPSSVELVEATPPLQVGPVGPVGPAHDPGSSRPDAEPSPA